MHFRGSSWDYQCSAFPCNYMTGAPGGHLDMLPACLPACLPALQFENAMHVADACSPAGPIDPKRVAARRAAAAEGLAGMGHQTAAAIARAGSGALQVQATSAVNQQQRGMQGAAARKRKQMLQEFNISSAAQAGGTPGLAGKPSVVRYLHVLELQA